ncbi:MAG: phenylalanine--tRNA ligase subunit beta [Lactobacillaceae bacterium]|jgi:phenylalanyl-tRNA synthetase beta chain|nr:phenylalanine--tRNA ligase subunit beta [Lactobacillaceae bacterium]
MKLSTNWLKEYIDLPVNNLEDGNKLAEQIGLTSSEVEEVSTVVPLSTNLVVAQVESVSAVPESDHLKLTSVTDGVQSYQVVTGAPNVQAGQVVVFAKPGATLFDGKEIKTATLAGIESNGMIVSLQEIGFTDSIAPKKHEDGIYVFPADADVVLGQDAMVALGANDIIVETSLTANRADMLSYLGNAYEFGAMLDLPTKKPAIDINESETMTDSLISVDIDGSIAPNYNLRIIQNVTVKESPLWLQRRLWSSGIRPINNIVDVTNYAMLLFGQPLHAFDYDTLTAKKIRVALSKNETLITLDDQERQLKEDENIVVYDDQKPLMLAGVMGGKDSEVTTNTTNIVLESAVFDSVLVRKAAQRFNLHSEASQRFERGINYDDIISALNFGAELIAELGDGQITKGIISQSVKTENNHEVEVTLGQINQYLGTDLSLEIVESVFKRLQFGFSLNDSTFLVDVPARTWDITLPVDLIEEVIRIYGYDKIKATLPQQIDAQAGLNKKQKLMRQVNAILRGTGLSQAITYSLKAKDNAQYFVPTPKATIELDYPMSEDRSVLRQSVLTSLYEAIKYNSARGQKDVRLFEIGDVFAYEDQKVEETTHLAGIVLPGESLNWKTHKNTFDFYDAKGIVENLFTQLAMPVEFAPAEINQMHPGRTAEISINDQVIGFVGQIHPSVTKADKINTAFAFELNLDAIIDLYENTVDYKPITKFPEMTRDLSLTVPKEVTQSQIQEAIDSLELEALQSMELFDIYNDEAYTYRLTFSDNVNALISENVDTLVDVIKNILIKKLGVEIR